MNRTWTRIVAAGVVAAALLPAAAQAGASKVLADIADRARGALVMVNYKIEQEGRTEAEEPTVRGLGVCLNAKEGWFMTLAISTTVRPDRMKDFTLVLPGPEGKSVKAKFMGMDPVTGISIVKATEAHSWREVRFAPSAELSVGQQVVSVSLLGGDGGRTPYVGTAYVSAVFRVPGPLAYVTGGKLTARGSPVFATDGRAIGLVASQLPLVYNMTTGRRSGSIRLAGQQETAFFLPVDEFVNVLRDPPVGKPRRLPWLGAVRVEPVSEELAGIIKLEQPGVMVDQIVDGHAAAKAGLKNRDVIVAMDGQPLEKLATPTLVARNFVRQLHRKKPGQSVKLTVLRGTKKPQELSVALEPMPMQPHEAERYAQSRLGFIVREKVEMDRYTDRGPTAKVDGLVTVFVQPRSAAAAGGLRPGDLITNCNDQDVKTVKAFRQIVDGAVANRPNEAINMLVRRGDQSMAISIQVPRKR